MATERLPLPVRRQPLLETVRHNQTVAGVLSLFSAITHRPPRLDTSIAWEDGEAEEKSDRQSER